MENKFNYTYKAPTEEERREIASIRRQYQTEEDTETKIEKLRRLDAAVKNTAVVVSLALGVIGCLVFGLGLTMILEWNMIVWGVLLSAVGALPMALAYPAYRLALKKGKEKYGAEILRLSEELLNEVE